MTSITTPPWFSVKEAKLAETHTQHTARNHVSCYQWTWLTFDIPVRFVLCLFICLRCVS